MSEQRIQCPAALDQESGRTLFDAVCGKAGARGASVVLDLSGTERMDARGGAWIVAIANDVTAHHGTLRYEGHKGEVADLMALIEPGLSASEKPERIEENFFEEIGGRVFKYAGEAGDFASLLVDAIYWVLVAPFEGRGFRWGLWMDEMYEMGVRAIRITCLMNFLLGVIIAMLSFAQVAPYGLGIFVANLIVIGFARELAAIMTAVVVSARTGAAIAAELATMKVQEEIDALRGMGLNVAQFLVAPKIVAMLIVMPCLVALGLLSGIAGGAFWAIVVVGFPPDKWFDQTIHAVQLSDLLQGFLKALAFAIMIVLVGCHNGFRVKGGSRGVGLMTTRAVVMDIFLMIVIDIIFATIFNYVLD